MQLTLFLSSRYLKGHPRQSVGSVLCVTLFFSAVLTTLLYRNCAQATFQREQWEAFGSYSSITYCADAGQVSANMERIRASGSGLVRVTKKLSTSGNSREIAFGSMDVNSIGLKAIQLKSGRLPQTAGEIAAESSTLNVLSRNTSVGDTVTLHFSDGTSGTYRLVGILQDYVSHWQSYDGTKASMKYPPPSVITLPGTGTVLYEHVVCGAGFSDRLGSSFLPEKATGHGYDGGKGTILNFLTLPLLVFFFLIMAFGILNLTNFTMQERRRSMKMLWNIGISRRRLIFLYYFEGLELFVAAEILSALISPLLCAGMTRLTSVFGSTMLLSFQGSSFLIAGLLGFVCVFFARMLQVPGLTEEKKKTRAVSRKQKQNNITALWHNAVKSRNRARSITSALLAAFCVSLAMFGTCISIIAPRDFAMGGTQTESDYELLVGGGTAKDFEITLPRKMGVSAEDLQLLYRTSGLQINYARVSGMTSQYFLLKNSQTNRYLDFWVNHPLCAEYSCSDTDTVRKAGGQAGDRIIPAEIVGLDWSSVRRQYPVLRSGSLQEEKFKNGEELLGPDTLCKVGDTFTIITPLVPDALPEDQIAQNVTFHISHATVAATYQPSQEGFPHMILSGEFILKTDPTARYDDISLSSSVSGDPEKRAEIENTLSGITADSLNVSMNNFVLARENLARITRSMQLQTTVAMFGFLLIVLLALFFSAYVDVKTNLHSYLLMRAVGIRGDTIRKLLWKETWRPVWKGALPGAVLPLAVTILRTKGLATYPLQLFVPPMCLAGIFTFCLLCCFSVLATVKPVSDLLKRSVAEELTSTE